MKNLMTALVACSLVGCATQRYQWGGYDEALYQSYKDPTKVEALRATLEAHITGIESSRQKVAPGLYAELGTLHLQRGDTARAVALYSKEREAWPESRGLMDAMISSIERRSKPAQETKQ